MKTTTIFAGLKDFFILWASQAVSTLGTAMTNFALILWVYSKQGTASSITLLSIFSYLPSILFCFIAGTLADKWDKKKIMLITDFVAALGTTATLVLFVTNSLAIWHLYIINFLLSFMNAFQNPASYVATSLLVPKAQYVRASGLYALSGSIITILAPALGSLCYTVGGLTLVLAIDLISFSIAFTILWLYIKIPKAPKQTGAIEQKGFWQSCLSGIKFLKANKALLSIILFFAFINFIAKMGGYGMMPAFVLGKTANNENALALVEAMVGLGTLIGSVFVTLLPTPKRQTRTIFIACALSFLLGDIAQAVTPNLPFWAAAAFISNIPMAFLNANLSAVMRTNIPLEMHGRVFAARDTLQYSTIPIGLFLGGALADYVLEPFMQGGSALAQSLGAIFGTCKGAGIAILFFIVGVIGFITCLLCLRKPLFKELDKWNPETT